MRAVLVLVALALALGLQTTLAHVLFGNRAIVDLVLVLVVYVGLVHGPVAGLLFGSLAGLLQDALSGGVVGVGGFSKSLVGFAVGVLGQQFIPLNPLPRFVVFFLGSLLHTACFVGLYTLIEPQRVGAPWGVALTLAAVNALAGILAFQVVERGPEWWYRRRLRRATLRRG